MDEVMAIRTSKRSNQSTHQHDDQETLLGNHDLSNRITELELLLSNSNKILEISRAREKKLALALEEFGVNVSLVTDVENGGSAESAFILDCPLEPNLTFFQSLLDRGGWLVGLLIFQSCSSFILAANEELLVAHPSIVYFLTMLVGAGIAVGALTERTVGQFIKRELLMAFSLCGLLGLTGFLRGLLSAHTSLAETVAITLTLMIIVLISIITGALLPLLLQQCRVDPAHSSTSIQVIMDITGVLITCSVATSLLDTQIGRLFLARLGCYG